MSGDDQARERASPPVRPTFAPRAKSPWLMLAIVLAFAAYQAWERNRPGQVADDAPDRPVAGGPVLDQVPKDREATPRKTVSTPRTTKAGANPNDGTYAVTHIADGDTINLEGKHRVRLIGINCPEIAHPEKDPPAQAQPWSAEAMNFTLAATRGKSVRIEFDPDYDETDHYGRWLCWVYYRDAGGEKLLNEELVRAGLAFVYDDRRRFPFSESIYRRLKAAQAEARRAQRGIYGEANVKSRD